MAQTNRWNKGEFRQEMDAVLSRGTYNYTADPSLLGKSLKTMLLITVGATVLLLASNFLQLDLLSSGQITMPAIESNNTRQRILSSLRLVIYITTAIIFLTWMHRANKNAQGFTKRTLEFTPGWAIGYFFMPLVNIYMPYKAMREIWCVSTDPDHGKAQPGSPLLGLWWTLWLATSVSGYAATALSRNVSSLADSQKATIAWILFNSISILAHIAALLVVVAISNKQQTLVDEGSNSSLRTDTPTA